MGKQLKKGEAPPGGKTVTKQNAERAEVVTAMEQRSSCVHFDNCVDLDKLLKKMKACKQIKCGECKGVDMKKRRSEEGEVIRFSFAAAKKAIWLCLECGRYICGGVGLPTDPQSHVIRHIKVTCHRLVIQCDNTRLRWCFPCQSLLPFEKEVNGEKIDLLLEVVKLIKERSSNSCSGETVAEDSCSSSISGEIKGLEARDGYGVRGLVNLGNTCFFNSVLQNLLSLDRLRDRLLKEDSCCGGPLVSSLKKLFTEATSEAGLFNSVINPVDFFGSVCSKAPQFRGYRQHDSHELLRCLLDGLSIEESSLRKKLDVADDSDKPTLVDSLFGGEVSSTISCLECGHSSKVYEPFLDLSLPVPSKKPPERKQQTISQEERSKLPPTTKVLENVADSKDSSEPVSTLALIDNNQVPEIFLTQKDSEEVGNFWCEPFGIEVSHNETDLVSQGDASETAPLLTQSEVVDNDGSAKQDKEGMQCSNNTASSGIDEAQVWGYPDIGQSSSSSANPLANEELPLLVADSQVMNMPYKDDISYNDKAVAEGKGEMQACSVVRNTFESSTETVMHDNDGSEKPDKEDAQAMQCSKVTASSDISAEISDAQVWGYPDLGQSFSSAKPCADEEVPLLVADSQVVSMPYKDDKTDSEDKDEGSSSYAKGHHEKTVDYVDFSWFFEEPDVSSDEDKTVTECEDEVSSSLMSSHHGQTMDNVDLNEPDVSCNSKTVNERQGEVTSSLVSSHHGKTVDDVDLNEPGVPCNAITIRECEDEVSSSVASSHHGQTVDDADLNEPGVPCNAKTVKECEGEVSSSLASCHHGQTVDYVDSGGCFDNSDVSCNDKSVKECEGEASSSFVSGHHEQNIENADCYWLFGEPKISQGPVFGPPTKPEASKACFMADSSNSDAEVLDDSGSPVTVDTCLDLFTKPEILSEDNAWHCVNCSNNLKLQRLRERRERFDYGWEYDNGFDQAAESEEVIVRRAATKRVLVNKAPPVLTIHLKRFSQDDQGRLSKLRGHVAFNEFIDLGLYIDMDSRLAEEDQPGYMLSGLVEHSGTMRRGHYVAYIRGDDKERRDSSVWYRASDSFVRQVSFEEVLRSEAYILFYQRI